MQYLTLGFIICQQISQIHQLNLSQVSLNLSQVSNGIVNTIFLHEILEDAIIYITIFASIFISKNPQVTKIIISCMIITDVMSYSQMSQGHFVFLSYAISYLLCAYLVITMFSQYKSTFCCIIIMATFQLFMSVSYFVSAEMGFYDISETFMYNNYAMLLYCIHMLIIISITDWQSLQRFRAYISYYVSIFKLECRYHLGI